MWAKCQPYSHCFGLDRVFHAGTGKWVPEPLKLAFCEGTECSLPTAKPPKHTCFPLLHPRSSLHHPLSFFPGIQSEFYINTTRAGPGTLSVTIEGPSKVKMDCQETPEGYKVMYTPMAPGNYLIGIKYGGPNHIMGSPFKAKVTGKH